MPTSKEDAKIVVGLVNEHLVGAKITGAEIIDQDEHWYRINLERDGEEFYLEPSIDPEGNAPGFLFMEV